MKNSDALLRINKFTDMVEKFVDICCVIFMLIIWLGVLSQIFGRWFRLKVIWIEEISTFTLVWLVFFGVATAFRHGLLAKVDIIVHLFKPEKKKYFEIFWDIMGILIMGLIVVSSRSYIANVFRNGTSSSVLHLPLWFVYMGPVIGFLFAIYFMIMDIINRVCGYEKEELTAEELIKEGLM